MFPKGNSFCASHYLSTAFKVIRLLMLIELSCETIAVFGIKVSLLTLVYYCIHIVVLYVFGQWFHMGCKKNLNVMRQTRRQKTEEAEIS